MLRLGGGFLFDAPGTTNACLEHVAIKQPWSSAITGIQARSVDAGWWMQQRRNRTSQQPDNNTQADAPDAHMHVHGYILRLVGMHICTRLPLRTHGTVDGCPMGAEL